MKRIGFLCLLLACVTLIAASCFKPDTLCVLTPSGTDDQTKDFSALESGSAGSEPQTEEERGTDTSLSDGERLEAAMRKFTCPFFKETSETSSASEADWEQFDEWIKSDDTIQMLTPYLTKLEELALLANEEGYVPFKDLHRLFGAPDFYPFSGVQGGVWVLENNVHMVGWFHQKQNGYWARFLFQKGGFGSGSGAPWSDHMTDHYLGRDQVETIDPSDYTTEELEVLKYLRDFDWGQGTLDPIPSKEKIEQLLPHLSFLRQLASMGELKTTVDKAFPVLGTPDYRAIFQEGSSMPYVMIWRLDEKVEIWTTMCHTESDQSSYYVGESLVVFVSVNEPSEFSHRVSWIAEK